MRRWPCRAEARPSDRDCVQRRDRGMQKLPRNLPSIIVGVVACVAASSTTAAAKLLLMRDPVRSGPAEQRQICSAYDAICAAPGAYGSSIDVTEGATGRVIWQIPVPGMLGHTELALSQNGKLLAVSPGS